MIPPFSISVLTVARNNLPGLQRTVASVLAQDYRNFEFIIVDGGSTDGTPEWLRTLRIDQLKWISEPDRGIADAYNKAMTMTSGDTVIFMNSGDTFVDGGTLSQVVASVPAGVKVQESILYGNYYQVTESEPYYVCAQAPTDQGWCSMNHQSALIGRAVCERFKYDERLKIELDYDYWLRCRAARIPFVKLDVTIARFMMDGLSGSLEYRVHSTMMCCFLFALNTGRIFRAQDAVRLCARVLRIHLAVVLRKLVGRRIIRGLKGFLRRAGLKRGPAS